MNTSLQSLHGNHACALAAVAAGCRFFAGYPITPSSEIAERMSRELPKVGGVFIQMEDEIASMAAIIGASIGGTRVMTATSGPGFSLKQENIGYASFAEIPCVIVDVMRGGPSTGMPTRPAQADIMQAKWGSHGDHPIVVLAPASVSEIYHETIRAFDISEQFRVPVILLYDQVIGHLLETIEVYDAPYPESAERTWADPDDKGYLPYAADESNVPVMARPGDGLRTHTTGLTHAENGYPTQDTDVVTRVTDRLLNKLDKNIAEIEKYEAVETDDADVLIVAIGISSRAAQRSVRNLREAGIRAGLFRPITLWPFPEGALQAAAAGTSMIVVPEMNAGQLVLEVERLVPDDCRVVPINKLDGEAISPNEIETVIRGIINDE